MWIQTLGQARRILIAVMGFTVIAIGVAMLITPGPGWLVIFFGLSILSAEFVWARRLLRRLKRSGVGIFRTLFERAPRSAAPAKGRRSAEQTAANQRLSSKPRNDDAP